MAAIGLDAVTKVFGDGTVAVDSLSLEIAAGEFVVMLGPSGCGKSTALRMIAGLESITTGTLRIGHRVANDLPPQDRGIAMVFQTFALYPQMTVRDNIAFPLQMAKVSTAEIEVRVAEVAVTLGIRGLLERYPAQLSGGQRQRAAMGRALVRRPTAFLMDEPLSNLDAGLRAELRGEIVALARHLSATTLYVTHDQTEAMTMADRVAVLRSGVLEQVGRPQQVYDDPATLFVAAFLGTPDEPDRGGVRAFLDDRVVLDLGEQELAVPWSSSRARPLSRYHNGRVVVGVRPEALTLGRGDGRMPSVRGRVRHVENHGHETFAHIDIGSTPVAKRLISSRREDVAVPRPRRALERIRGTRARRRVATAVLDDPHDTADPAHAYRVADIVLRLPARSTVDSGDHVPVTVDTDRLHLFDAVTGRALPAYSL